MRTQLGAMPLGRPMETVDERIVNAPLDVIYRLARDVAAWPAHLAHYNFVNFRESDGAGGGIVEMSADRQFGAGLNWPTWWLSAMEVDERKPAIRFRHIGGVTKGMDVEWTFEPFPAGTQVRILHVWDGPKWPLIGIPAATLIIGPVFVHGIAARTLAGLAAVAERERAEMTAGKVT